MDQQNLNRNLGLIGLIATGASSMIGASIYIIPFEIQAAVPGLGNNVLTAFLIAAIPALFSAFAYAILSSYMPESGGSYIYVSRTLHPFLGFVASFSQWFGLSIVIGVVAYMTTPFISDIASQLGFNNLSASLKTGLFRLLFSMLLLWTFVLVNIAGIKSYQIIVVLLVSLTLILGSAVIYFTFVNSRESFISTIELSSSQNFHIKPHQFDWKNIIVASTILFSSFIGFDSIAQAGGEAINPTKNLPLAILITFVMVTSFYLLYTFGMYNLVPWNFIESEAITKDVSAVSLLGYILNKNALLIILIGASIALLKDLPSMILSVSRFVYAWSCDGLFPSFFAKVHPFLKTPYYAILFSGIVASVGILGCHFAADIFLGIDLMIVSMIINFILICCSVIYIPKKLTDTNAGVSIIKNRIIQKLIAIMGIIMLLFFLIIIIINDITSKQKAIFYHPTFVWMVVMLSAAVFYFTYPKKK